MSSTYDDLVLKTNYRQTLVTHDPVQYTHMAFLPFPSTWPLFTPKDKIGDWFEAYASLLELNVWMNTRIDNAEYNDDTGEWLVQVERGGELNRKLKPRHVIMCTGVTSFKTRPGTIG